MNPSSESATAGSGGERTPRLFVAAVAAGILRVCLTSSNSPPDTSALVLEPFTRLPMQHWAAGDPGTHGRWRILDGRRTDADGTLEIGLTGGSEPFVRLSGVRLTPVDLLRYDTGGEPPRIEMVTTVDGSRARVTNLASRVAGRAFTAEFALSLPNDEGLYGLGQEEEGGYNRRRTRVHLYQNNMRTPMPCLVSDHGYGILIDCPSLMVFDDTGDRTRIMLDAVPAIDCYLIAGGAEKVIRGFRWLTGAAPLPPKWAFGYVQSKEHYRTAAELLEVARRHRTLGVPLDCVVQDWKTWSGDEWGQKTVDRARYPDLEALRDSLHAMNVHSMVSVWPNLAPGCPDHAELAAAGLLLGDHSTYDAFDPRAREVYWRQLNAELRAGFDAWWCDSTEPFSAPDWQGEAKRSEEERFKSVGGEHQRYLGAERANLYALEHARGLYEHERAGPVARRVLNLSRSGYPGIQRYGAVLWSGDVSATWETLRGEVARAISMGLSGVPWWTTDAGGFFAGGIECRRRWGDDPEAAPLWFWAGDYDDGVANPGYRELYARWLQFGCFLPMFRSHGTDTPREIWNFGTAGEPFYDAIAATIRLRYRLLPYLYTTAADAALDHQVMIRALLFDHADDPVARATADQYLLGSSLLVCPVLAPSRYGKDGQPLPPRDRPGQYRRCYLPQGSIWHDYWTGQRFEGGQYVMVPAPLDQIPLFVTAGTVLPLQGPVSHALENRDSFELAIYPGADGTGRLYDDDGLSYAYETGGYTLVQFEWYDSSRTLRIHSAQWTRTRPMTFRIRLAAPVDTAPGPSAACIEAFDGRELTVRL